jgi:hypothetical protein
MPLWGKKITDPENAVAMYVSLADAAISAEVNLEEDDYNEDNEVTLSTDSAVDLFTLSGVEGHQFTIIPEGGDIRVKLDGTAVNSPTNGFLVRDGEAWSEKIKFLTNISIIRTAVVATFVRGWIGGKTI